MVQERRHNQFRGSQLAEQGFKDEHDPRQEGQDAQKGRFGCRIAPTPHIAVQGHHDGERVVEEVNVTGGTLTMLNRSIHTEQAVGRNEFGRTRNKALRCLPH
jgi:hypothetical protein